jgi:methionyl-tRNA formyltransferase
MNSLRIIFMGTPEFAVESLRVLLRERQHIVGVITAPDKPSGRGRKINQSAVKLFANEQNLLVLQPTNLKDPNFIDTLAKLNADLQIVVAFRMLPKVVWNMPKMGTFNLHASLLPKYRGAAPINWAIINGEKETGVTTFFINENIDTGSILLQKKVTITNTCTAGELHDKLMYFGAELIMDTVTLINRKNFKVIEQPASANFPAPKLDKENCKINWFDSLNNIFDQIRGLSPYPAAWSYLLNYDQKMEIKIYKVEKIVDQHDFETGKVIFSKKEILIAVKNGYIKVLELKLPGKRKMDAKSLLNGFTFCENAKMI